MTMTHTATLVRPAVCRYCGIATSTGASHSSEPECIEALTAEIEKAKQLIRGGLEMVAEGRPHVRRPAVP